MIGYPASTKQLQFRVYGMPRPAGSKRGFHIKKAGKTIVVDTNKHSKTWKGDVKDAALSVAPDTLLSGPLILEVVFVMPRPKAHYRTGRYASELKPSAPEHHINTPDVTKLMRGTEDALKGIIWVDDSLIYKQIGEKVYGERPGAIITVIWQEPVDGSPC